jgi:hypothetical protein
VQHPGSVNEQAGEASARRRPNLFSSWKLHLALVSLEGSALRLLGIEVLVAGKESRQLLSSSGGP